MRYNFNVFPFIFSSIRIIVLHMRNSTHNNMTSNNNNNNTHNATTELGNTNNEIIFKDLQLAFLLNLQIAGFIMSTMLLLLSATRRRYYLLLNLAISNYIAVILLTLQIISLVSPQPQSNNGVHNMPCEVLLSITEMWWMTQNYTLVAISYERYKNVTARQHKGSCDSVCSRILFIWVVGVVAVLVLLLTPWITIRYDPDVLRCRKIWEKYQGYMLIYSMASFWIPGFFLTYFKVYMFFVSYKKRHSESRPYSQAVNLKRSWSSSSLASLRDLRIAMHGKLRRLSRSESLPASLDWERNASSYSPSSGQTSRQDGSDYSSMYQKRKRSLSNTTLKPLMSTLLILIPYLMASAPETTLIYIYSADIKSNQMLDLMHKFKYLVVVYFPVILCSTDKEVKKGLRKLYRRLRCWRSGRISPTDNIDYSDYRENIMRRDSRRSSMMSRTNSVGMIAVEEPMAAIPYNGKESPSKSNSPVGCASPSGKKRTSIIAVNPYGNNSPDVSSSSLSDEEQTSVITLTPYKGNDSPDRGTTFFINSPINTPVV